MKSGLLSARRRSWPARTVSSTTRTDARSPASLPSEATGVEALEGRQLLSGSIITYTPGQVRHAYGFDQACFYDSAGKKRLADGAGQTIAIIDAYDDPDIAHDLQVFDKQYDLPNDDVLGQPILTKVRLSDGSGLASPSAQWSQEIALDVEWAHGIAPEAHILLVEACSTSLPDLAQAVNYARSQRDVSVISMSWDGMEFPSERNYDSLFTTPRGHIGGGNVAGGITFVSATGDDGAPACWPATSPNVLGVGGTTLHLSGNGSWAAEDGWDFSGGGVSFYEPEPYWQQAAAPDVGYRTSPDVAYDADPDDGFNVYDSVPIGSHVGWETLGGTSGGAPQWAALIAIADQGRAFAGKKSLDGPTQTLPAIYKLPESDYHDIDTGNNGYLATPGYNPVTGRGTPIANRVIAGLVNV